MRTGPGSRPWILWGSGHGDRYDYLVFKGDRFRSFFAPLPNAETVELAMTDKRLESLDPEEGFRSIGVTVSRPVRRQVLLARLRRPSDEAAARGELPGGGAEAEHGERAGGAKFWFHALRNCFITVAERELMLPRSLTKRLVNHARPGDVTEGYAADWTVGQLREPAQRIADRIDALMNADAPADQAAA